MGTGEQLWCYKCVEMRKSNLHKDCALFYLYEEAHILSITTPSTATQDAFEYNDMSFLLLTITTNRT